MKNTIGFVVIAILIATTACNTNSRLDGYISEKDTVIKVDGSINNMSEHDTLRKVNGKWETHPFSGIVSLDLIDEIKNSDHTVYLGVEVDAPPMNFNDNGKPSGFEYNLFQAVYKKVFPGTVSKVLQSDYNKAEKDLIDKKIHIIGGGHTPFMSKNIDWTEPYLQYGYCLITRVGNASIIKTAEDLNNKTVIVYDEDAKTFLKTKAPNAKIVMQGKEMPAEDANTPQSDWMTPCVDRRVDAIIYDYPFAVKEIKDYHDNLIIVNKNLNELNELRGYAFGIPSGNAAILNKLNDAIKEFKQSPEYAILINTYIPNPDDNSKLIIAPGDYKVKQGDNLHLIAKALLHDGSKWKEIYNINKDRLASPDILYTGTILKVPTLSK